MTVEAIHGLSRIAKVLGVTRSAAIRLAEAGAIQTYQVSGHTCVAADELDRFDQGLSGIDRWEGEGGSIAP